jgi:hypothetical protein
VTVTNRQVRHYECEMVLSANTKAPGPLGFVYLYGEGRELLASLGFHADPARLKPAEEQADGTILASLLREELPVLIDLLRNEKPVFLRWTSATATLRLTTGEEPVGEEELKRMFSWLYI